MATIKSFTSLEQSKKLSEFLTHESADMKILPFNEREYRIVPINDIAVCDREDEIYAWSLAALLSVLPDIHLKKYIYDGITKYYATLIGIRQFNSKHYDNPVDACYEMILKLNKLKML